MFINPVGIVFLLSVKALSTKAQFGIQKIQDSVDQIQDELL